MRLTPITTELLVTAACAISMAVAADSALEGLADSASKSRRSFHLITDHVAIALHAEGRSADGEGAEGSLPRARRSGRLLFGLALPDLGLRAMHSVSFSAPRTGGGSAGGVTAVFGGASVRVNVAWRAAMG